MERVHCTLSQLDRILKDKNINETSSTITEDESGRYLVTMANWKQYITKLADRVKKDEKKE